MSAKNTSRKDEEGIYSHIYNKGLDSKIIFNSEDDYNVFLGYLNEYLTVPQDPTSIKKEFVVNGRTFKGTPHQPKNYFNKVELIAYCLKPDRFDLLLHQLSAGSLESFIRSICTRYSIYFNKKYQRTGSLFAGPYKSNLINHQRELLNLTQALHHGQGLSSYPEYLGKRVTSWVNPSVILTYFGKGPAAYRDFVDKYQRDEPRNELLNQAAYKDNTVELERNGLTRYSIRPRVIAVSTIIFFLLLAAGMLNIVASTPKMLSSVPAPAVLSETTKSEEAPPHKTTLTVKTLDDSVGVNIRQNPSADSRVIAVAKNGDVFEFVSPGPEWYEIKLDNGSTGFISSAFITVNNQ